MQGECGMRPEPRWVQGIALNPMWFRAALHAT